MEEENRKWRLSNKIIQPEEKKKMKKVSERSRTESSILSCTFLNSWRIEEARERGKRISEEIVAEKATH